MTSIVQQNCQIIKLLTEKTWERGLVVSVVSTSTFHSFHEQEIGELLAKNIARRQLDGRHLLLENICAGEQLCIS